ncbi:unnamed protein product [Spirodela intermedia]|uniref:Uncharacterized protein n=1 Tax=Spirodela intermedia TaxID=51605 RepID=A0A7I8LLZ6_SPIIN|nr:unnamed protein product [Spirodela intermedia]
MLPFSSIAAKQIRYLFESYKDSDFDYVVRELCQALNLSTSEKIAIGLALSDSENFDFRMRGKNFCVSQIDEICANPIPILSHKQIQEIFMFLYRSEGLSKHMDSFMKMLSLLQLERSEFVLSPILEEDLSGENSFRPLDLFYGHSDNDFDAVLAEIEREMSMADIIRELGYGCTATVSHCKEMLSLFLPLDELTICKILVTIACTHVGNEESQNAHSTFCSAVGINSTADSSSLSSWNFDVVVDSIKQLAPETNWNRVIENMDHELFFIPDEPSFSTFMSIYAHACQEPFPLHAICGSVWKNAEGQLSFLRYAVSASPEVFTFAHSGNKLPYVESAQFQSGHGNQAWYCLDLLDLLSQLAERGHAISVRALLEYPLQQLPEILLLGVAHTNSAYNLLQYEISSSVFPLIVKNSAESSVVHHLWHTNPKIVLRGFMDMYNVDPESIFRIVDVCQELKILSSVLETTPFSFSIKLATFASRKEYISLEQWLSENLSMYQDSFFQVCVDFLKGIIGDGMNDRPLGHPAASMNAYEEVSPIFLKVLQTHSGLVSEELCEELKKLLLTATRVKSRVQIDTDSEISASDGSADDVEVEANSYFHQMFSEQLSVDTMVQTLARFKESSERREQLVFECMIGNLFEEYKFFTKYPDRQLSIAAVLFGMHRQPSYNTGFGAAMNIETLVQAAERRDTPIEAPGSEIQDKILFMINNISLTNVDAKAKEFIEILNEKYYPWFAQYMVMKRASIEPNFHDLYLKFLDKVNSKTLNKEILKATYENCKVLLGSDLIKSSSEERSLLKNLGSWLGKFTIGRNQVLRAREIDPKVLIVEAYEKGLMIAVIPFTSKILEPCQSSLAYKPPNPWTMGILSLLAEIYNLPSLKMNLRFDIEVLFKNLGVDLKDVKPSLLLKDRGRELEGNPDFSTKDISTSQTPVVAEVNSGMIPTLNPVDLPPEASGSSHTGVHPNVLSQFSALQLASNALAEEERMGTLTIPERVPSAQGLSQVIPSQTQFSISQSSSAIPNIGMHVVVNQKLNALGLHLQFQRVLPLAMEKAIREIISPVVQRSVTIASQTTKELVLKDYAMESDESRIYNAAHLMVASLAGSLAHVTCKEPLRIAMSANLRTLLQSLSVSSELLEQAVQLVTNDNLDLGCAVIEQAATEKALQTIDAEITKSLDFRRKQREGTGSAYFDAGTYAQGPFARVPEALRPKPGRLSIAQQRVYEDFLRVPLQSQPSQSSSVLPAVQSSSSGGSVSSAAAQVYGPASGQLNSGIHLTQQAAPGFNTTAQQLDLISEEIDQSASSHGVVADALQQTAGISTITSSFPAPPELHVVEPSPVLESLIVKNAREADIQGVVAEVPEIILKCVSRDEAALAVAQKVFRSLYENASNNLHVSSHLAILSAIRDVCKLVVKELTSWVIYSDEERKFNREIAVGLIYSELLNLAEYNAHLAKLIDGGRNKTATEFAIALVQTLVSQESSLSAELYNTIDALSKLLGRPGAPESLVQLFDTLRSTSSNVISVPGFPAAKEEKTRQPKEKRVSLLFADWFRLNDLPATDAAYTHYISQLQQNGFLKGDERTDSFFRIITEISVGHCISSEQTITTSQLSIQSPHQVQHLSFSAIDAYAKLVVLILKYSLLDQGSSKVALLPKILSIVVNFIQKDAEEKKSGFNPRPYFRLFVYWLWEFNSSDFIDGVNLQVLISFANAFHALQPLKVPGLSFAWLELISHRSFMPRLLASSNSFKGWPFFHRLLVDLFKFMEPCLRNAELGEPVRFLYKGTLRVLLVLLHDFPDFLCEYHFSFCDVIPPSCIQMRNVILSAFPPKMRLPDPSTPNLKIDLLAEISQSPRILSDIEGALKTKILKADVDEYLKTRPQGSSFLTELKARLLLPPSESIQAGTQYNVPLINSLVLYVGVQVTPTPDEQSLTLHLGING